MHKFTIIASLLALSTLSFANTTATQEKTTYTSVRNLPVIVKNEVIAPNICRLSFENGATRNVPCNPYAEVAHAAATQPVNVPSGQRSRQ